MSEVQRIFDDTADGGVRDQTPEEIQRAREEAKKVQISCTVTARVRDALQAQADEEDRAVGVVMRRAIEQYLGLK